MAMIPKRLSTVVANKLHDFRQHVEALEFAQACFNDLVRSSATTVYGPALLLSDPVNRHHWALFAAGAIYYRRPFTTGVRTSVGRDELGVALSKDEFALHQRLLAIADKHVAHSVNNMELGHTTVWIEVEDGGLVTRGGSGSLGRSAGPMSHNDQRAVVALIGTALAGFFTPRIRALEREVAEYVQGLSDAELLALPDGYAPDEPVVHDKARKQFARK